MVSGMNKNPWQSQVAIDPNSLRPLYLQVKEALEEWILDSTHSGSLSPGDRLPSENELSNELGVSSITVKRALDELRRQGLIRRIQGRGSFVSPPKIILPLPHLFSLTRLLREKGMHPVRETLEIAELSGKPGLTRRLNLHGGERLIKLVRVLRMEHQPVAIDTTYLPQKYFPGFLANYDEEAGMYATMEKYYDLEIIRTEDLIEPVLINPFESEVLEAPVGSLGMIFKRTGYGKENIILEYTRSVFRGDQCSFSIQFNKENSEGES